MYSNQPGCNTKDLAPILRNLWGSKLIWDNTILNNDRNISTCSVWCRLQAEVFPRMVYVHYGLYDEMPSEKGTVHVFLDEQNSIIFIGVVPLSV